MARLSIVYFMLVIVAAFSAPAVAVPAAGPGAALFRRSCADCSDVEYWYTPVVHASAHAILTFNLPSTWAAPPPRSAVRLPSFGSEFAYPGAPAGSVACITYAGDGGRSLYRRYNFASDCTQLGYYQTCTETPTDTTAGMASNADCYDYCISKNAAERWAWKGSGSGDCKCFPGTTCTLAGQYGWIVYGCNI
ncbi:hypothetical protein DFJ74DRAFT_688578 [Hyaloraphidium curvatum]|nr:hypothetical protein DFJ74DRAFT_688578 [Hyaloraphidium curvatum]